jgi:hypothetical protein
MCEICLIREFMQELADGRLTDPEREDWHNTLAMAFAKRRGLTVFEAALALTDMPREHR